MTFRTDLIASPLQQHPFEAVAHQRPALPVDVLLAPHQQDFIISARDRLAATQGDKPDAQGERPMFPSRWDIGGTVDTSPEAIFGTRRRLDADTVWNVGELATLGITPEHSGVPLVTGTRRTRHQTRTHLTPAHTVPSRSRGLEPTR